jgi:hypothetical protein
MGTVEWFDPFSAPFHEGELPLCWASPAHSGSMQQCLQIYGAISDSALELMRQLAGPVPLTVKPHGVGGFTRSAAERAHVVS